MRIKWKILQCALKFHIASILLHTIFAHVRRRAHKFLYVSNFFLLNINARERSVSRFIAYCGDFMANWRVNYPILHLQFYDDTGIYAPFKANKIRAHAHRHSSVRVRVSVPICCSGNKVEHIWLHFTNTKMMTNKSNKWNRTKQLKYSSLHVLIFVVVVVVVYFYSAFFKRIIYNFVVVFYRFNCHYF